MMIFPNIYNKGNLKRGVYIMNEREELLEKLESSISNLSDEEMQELIDYAEDLINQRIQ